MASLAAYGQSLGDVARENREKQAADASTTPPKVITNASLPKDPNAGADPSAGESKTPTAPQPANVESSKKTAGQQAAEQHLTEQHLTEQRAAQQRMAEQRAAGQWKKKILAQENTIANLRMQAARLKASIHYMNPNATDDNPMVVNRYQARQLDHLAQVQQQLAEQRKKLEDMQEAARHAGMHTTVYDP